MKYAGFWKRLSSIVIDGLVFSPFLLLQIWLDSVSRTTALIASVIYIILVATYDIWFVAKYGQTPGKMAVGIMIVKVDGLSVSWKEAFLRHSVNIVFAIINGIVLCYAITQIPESEYISLSWKMRNQRIYEFYPAWINTLSNIWIWSEVVVLLFNKKKRALHDFIAGTVVIHTRTSTANTVMDTCVDNTSAQVPP